MYREVKSDTFLAVSASGVLVLVCDADVTHDILSRKDDFPKSPEVYPMLDIFGRNVVTTNNLEWKKHRRVITPHFGENYNRLAWMKGLEKTELLTKSWRTPLPGQSHGRLITSTAEDFMRLTLHITFLNMFGRNLRWPNRIPAGPDDIEGLSTDEEIPKNHTMTFQSCLHQVLEYCIVLLVAPNWYMNYSPVKAHRKAGEAYKELDLYLKEMVQEKRKEIEDHTSQGGDLISALIHAKESEEKSAKGRPGLTEQEIIGNTFMLVFTGHATTTNTLHYTIMMLAIYPEYQMKLQEELDRILGDREPTYEKDYPALAEGWAGAIFYETLRLFPSVPNLPKFAPTPVYITVQGTKHLIPGGTHIHLNTSNTHRNPKYWVKPHQTEQEAAINDFRPERWFTNTDDQLENPAKTSSKEGDLQTPQSFFKPYNGSYFPWSEGQRVCLGKKYSIVELLAIYIVIFRKWSLELDVREGETIDQARDKAKKYVGDIDIVVALKPKGKQPGIRYVRRGEERYFPKRQ